MPDGVSCVLTLAGLTLGELRLGPPPGWNTLPESAAHTLGLPRSEDRRESTSILIPRGTALLPLTVGTYNSTETGELEGQEERSERGHGKWEKQVGAMK